MFDLKLTLKLTSAATFDQIWAWGWRPQALLQRRGREILENVEPPRLLTAAQIFLEKDVDSTKTRTHNCNATQLKHLPTSGNPLVAFIQLREPSFFIYTSSAISEPLGPSSTLLATPQSSPARVPIYVYHYLHLAFSFFLFITLKLNLQPEIFPMMQQLGP